MFRYQAQSFGYEWVFIPDILLCERRIADFDSASLGSNPSPQPVNALLSAF